MTRITIDINGRAIGGETARRIKGGTDPDDINTYILYSNEKKIKHRCGDGALKLVDKMIKTTSKSAEQQFTVKE